MNSRNHLYALSPLMIFTLIMSIGVFLFYQWYGIPDKLMATLIFFLYFIFAAPVIFLHVEYIINDWAVSLTINKRNRDIIYKKGNCEIIFNLDEIESVQFFGETKDFNNLTTQNHYFYLIKAKDYRPFIISCLVIRNIENNFSNIRIIKNRRLFPSIFFEVSLKYFTKK